MKCNQLLRLISIINSLLIIPACNAQNPSETLLEEVFEYESVNNDVEESHWEEELEELSTRLKEPIDLNTATRQQLEQFPFLSDIQIEQLLAYIHLHDGMKTIYELQLVKEMDLKTIRYLLPFVSIKTMNKEDDLQLKSLLRNSWKYGRNELITRMDIPFYKRKGYEQAYHGPAVYNSVRYGFRYKENISFGLTAEKDAGEPFFALWNKSGYDYYSFHFMLRQKGCMKTLALGNYRLSFGQGLVIGTNYLLGKTIYATTLTPRSEGIRKHASTDEYNYFRGAASTFALGKRWTVTGFYSHRLLDGTVEGDEITSIYKTGLHRTQKEADKRQSCTMQLAGGNLTYQQNRLKLGLTGIYYFFDRPYEPDLNGYARYNLHGKSFYNLGGNYSYRWRRFSFQGETAMGRYGVATLNRLQYSPTQGYQLLLIHRYYSQDYWAMFAHSFGESSGVQNEKGCYLAADLSPIPHWRFFASADLFSFPWMKYRISKPSGGFDGLLQADFSPRKELVMYLRYRYKRKERDVSGTDGQEILPNFHHQLRFRLNYSQEQRFSFRTTLECTRFHSCGITPSLGYQASQMFSCQLPRMPIRIEVQATYFHTDDYDSRIYAAEKGLLYTFYTPSFQGEGFRFSTHLRYDFNKHWMLITKFGETIYNDRNEIGSGNDLIRGNKKADLQMQLCMKF